MNVSVLDYVSNQKENEDCNIQQQRKHDDYAFSLAGSGEHLFLVN